MHIYLLTNTNKAAWISAVNCSLWHVRLFQLFCFLQFSCFHSFHRRSSYAYVSVCLNGLCLLIYVTDVMLSIVFLSWKVFFCHEDNYWSRYEVCRSRCSYLYHCNNRRELFLIILFTIDWILFICQVITITPWVLFPVVLLLLKVLCRHLLVLSAYCVCFVCIVCVYVYLWAHSNPRYPRLCSHSEVFDQQWLSASPKI